MIPDFAGNHVPVSSGGLQELIKARIAPLIYKRTSCTSIERTNCLTDLAICAARFQLDDPKEIARRLRADAHAHAGFAPAPRTVADPMNTDRGTRYRSLRDRSLSSRIAYSRLAA